MSVDSVSLLAAVQSHAQALGLFEKVLIHEPENAPDNGITAACWLDNGRPLPDLSGLTATSWRLQLTMRLYVNLLNEPQEGTETRLAGACDALIADYSGAFTLGGLVEQVDLMGGYGEPLSWKFEYGTHNHKLYRLATIVLPLIVADVYSEAP